MELTLHNQASEISLVHQALDEFVTQNALESTDFAKLHVALEEHLANIISYGYESGQAGTIRLRFSVGSSALTVEIEDDGRPFNPLDAPAVDTSLSLDQKPIGGLGLHLIRKCVDEASYSRAEHHNRLVMSKRLKSAKR